jgi:predicted component of type VI protein secretion system
VDESTVAGQHASVEYAEDGTVWLTEVAEGSTNGIRVNQHQVLTPGRGLRIHTGDTVWLGPHVNFLVRGGTLPGTGTDTAADDSGQPPGA